MTPEQAAWVRENVLSRHMRDSFDPRCACQKGLSAPCRRGDHDQCAHHKHAAYYARGEAETHLQRGSSSWSVCWPGFISVDIWLADRVCAWRCPCAACHPHPAVRPEPTEPAVSAPVPAAMPEPHAWADGLLFDLEAS